MQRLIIVAVVAVCAAASSLARQPLLGLVLAVVPGLYFFGMSFASAGGISQARLPQFKKAQPPVDPQPPADLNVGIGLGLVTAGVSIAAAGNAHFPHDFQIFYAACAAAGLFISVYQAWKGRADRPV